MSAKEGLSKAIKAGDLDAVKEIVENNKVNINQVIDTSTNYTPLIFATYYNKIDIVKYLIKKGADIDKKSNFNGDVLGLSAHLGQLDLVKLFINMGMNVDEKQYQGISPLMLAIDANHKDVIEYLLEAGADINHKDNNMITPLYEVLDGGGISDSVNFELADYLLSKGADVKIKNKNNATVLFPAVSNIIETNASQMKVLNKIIDAGVDINAVSKSKVTALQIACVMNKEKIAKLLLDKGAKLDVKNDEGVTELFDACGRRSMAIVELLLDKGANIEAVNELNQTPLFIATMNDDTELVKYLIEWGANINHKDANGITPCFLAARYGIEDLVKLYITRPGFDKDVKFKGKTLLELAEDFQFKTKINDLIVSLFDIKWEGWSRSDAKAMEGIFDTDNAEAMEDVSYCPICLGYTIRSGAAGETKGCMYMHHDCTKTGARYHKGLYDKYKTEDGNIYWCTICNRIARGHSHYELEAPNPKTPLPPLIRGTGSPFDKSCVTGHGGGGVDEKLRRFIRLREMAKELNEEKGTISKRAAVETLVEEMWLAGLEKRRNARRVETLKKQKKYEIEAENFPENRPVTGAVERNYPNVTRSAENLASLKPRISMQKKYDAVEMEELAPAVLFSHRKPNGDIVRHEAGEGNTGEGGEWLGFETVKSRVAYYIKNFNAEDFGECPIGCGARLYPDEVKEVVSEEMYEQYKKAFNKHFAAKGGGRSGKRGWGTRKKLQRNVAAKKLRGGDRSEESGSIFHKLTNEVCVRPWKTAATRRAARR